MNLSIDNNFNWVQTSDAFALCYRIHICAKQYAFGDRLKSRIYFDQIARDEARKILDDARETAEIEKAEVEEYIDGRLATLEVILNKTMDAVSRGRDRLAGANDKDVLSQLADEN